MSQPRQQHQHRHPQASSRKLSKTETGRANQRSPQQLARTRELAQQLIASIREKRHVIGYTDGCCLGNPGRGGSAAVLEYMSMDDVTETRVRRVRLSRGFGEERVTNNFCELKAIEMALDSFERRPDPRPQHLHILSDSLYCVNLCQPPYKFQPKANVELVMAIRTVVERMRGAVEFHWVGGHAGIEGNELADQLSMQAANNHK